MVAIVDFQEQNFQCESLGISEFLSLVILICFLKFFFFLMWPLFKLFIEFITILLLFFVFGCWAARHGVGSSLPDQGSNPYSLHWEVKS